MKCSGGHTTFCRPGSEGSSRNSSVYVFSFLSAIMYPLSTGGTGSAQVAAGARGRPALGLNARPCRLYTCKFNHALALQMVRRMFDGF